MRHIIVLAVFAAIVTSAFTTVLVNGLIVGANPVRSATEDAATGIVHSATEAYRFGNYGNGHGGSQCGRVEPTGSGYGELSE